MVSEHSSDMYGPWVMEKELLKGLTLMDRPSENMEITYFMVTSSAWLRHGVFMYMCVCSSIILFQLGGQWSPLSNT